MAEENGKTKARELVSISITPFEGAWDGKTTTTDKRFGDGKHKFTVTVPVPENDADAQDIYGMSLVDLITAGVIQKWYGSRHLDNVIQELKEKGADPNSQETLDTVTKAAADQSWEKVERTGKTKELKALKGELDGLGMSPAEAIALLKKMKAQA